MEVIARFDWPMSKLKTIVRVLQEWPRRPFFGFVQGHAYLGPHELAQLSPLVGKSVPEVTRDFENRFASIVGDGHAVSFAAGRMGFFALMRVLAVGPGDEVVLHGATCSVMVNAILRTGATPVFSDIDPETFGSSAQHIEKCITPRTRMIVAQHSFGIPCDIAPIVELARSLQVFLLEDCALSLGSKIDGVAVGNFGDAALFSTDHSKPINTLIGGLIYTRDTTLANRLIKAQAAAPELLIVKQQALWRRLCLERRYCKPSKYGRMGVIDLLAAISAKFLKRIRPFLDEDSHAIPSLGYPYPAKMPGFLAAVGILETKRWTEVAEERKAFLRGLLDAVGNGRMPYPIPGAYFNKRLDIVPLRLAWTQPDGASVRKRLGGFIHVPWTWFLQPIIATGDALESFGYRRGVCPISERIGPGMVNLPCNLLQDDSKKLLELFQVSMSSSTVIPDHKKVILPYGAAFDVSHSE